MPPILLDPHSSYGRFSLERSVFISEIQVLLRLIEHVPSGAKVLHLEADDQENAFCLSFRTYPKTGNGVAHILEHTVLCGSKRFPVRDPFFLMGRRSLNTFMNAFTGGDFTCYPASTENKEDFYNLLDVYLDAVFNPCLTRLSFLQEGHRLEFSDPKDHRSPLEFKGVVYNEMKGSYASPERRLHEEINKQLFPTLCYGVDSGGFPPLIPTLTHEELIAFHKTYYHPSQALFYFYGNLPLVQHLDFLEDKLLKDVKKESPLPRLPREKRLTQPIRTNGHFPIGRLEESLGKGRMGIGWLTAPSDDQLTALSLTVLIMAILDTDASPLKKKMLSSKLVKQVSAFIDTESSEIPVVMTFKGFDEDKVRLIEDEVISILEKLIKEPIEKDLIESALHQIEFHRTEINGDDLPWGLNLFMRAGLILQQGGDPEEALRIHSHFQLLRDLWNQDPFYFNKLIDKWLIKNPHRVVVNLSPDPDLSEREDLEEKKLLDSIKLRLTSQEVEKIIQDAEDLELIQEDGKEGEEVLPKLPIEAIPPQPKDYPLKIRRGEDLDVYHHEAFTNGVVYADLLFPIPLEAAQDRFLLRLLTEFLTQLGTDERDYENLLQLIQKKTGGVSASIVLFNPLQESKTCYPYLALSGKALDRNVESLFQVFKEIVDSISFKDSRRFKEVWDKHLTSITSAIPSQAMSYVTRLASCPLSSTETLSQELFGLDYVWSLENLKDRFSSDELREELKKISTLIFDQKGDLVLSVTTDSYKRLESENFFGVGRGMKGRRHPFIPQDLDKRFGSHGRLFASPVAFISHVLPSVDYQQEAAPALSLASFILDNQTLHTKVREQGGAYGVGSRQQNTRGLFSFYSYRDPHIGGTLEAFKMSLEKLVKRGVSPSELEEAKLEMIQGLDTPVSPGSRGMVAYTWEREGRTLSKRELFRRRLLSVSTSDITEAVRQHLLASFDQGVTVVAAGGELFEKEHLRRIKKGLSPLSVLPLEKENNG